MDELWPSRLVYVYLQKKKPCTLPSPERVRLPGNQGVWHQRPRKPTGNQGEV